MAGGRRFVMGALITIDLDQVHPVVEGRWHRVRLLRMPGPGELITMFCGQVEEVVYGTSKDQVITVRTWWACDLVYRRAEGIAVPSGHPGLTRT